MKIILIGFMGAGKTSVAHELGHILQLPISDMDELVLSKTGTKNMHELFEKGGEILLRETEIEIAKDFSCLDHRVISTGGGVILNKIVLDYLKRGEGKIFYLHASFHTISHRLEKESSRPLFKNLREAEKLYHFRQPLYWKYSDYQIQADNKSVKEIAHEIADLVDRE